MITPSFSTFMFIKNASFRRIALKPKSWILSPKDFEFLDIFIESKWGGIPLFTFMF